MTYRDHEARYRERAEQLERADVAQRARIAALLSERDELRRRLDHLARDPRALRRVQREHETRRGLYRMLRIIGGVLLALVLVPFAALSLVLASEGSTAGAIICGAVPLVCALGLALTKLPDLLTSFELRYERRKASAQVAALEGYPSLRARVEEAHEARAQEEAELAYAALDARGQRLSG